MTTKQWMTGRGNMPRVAVGKIHIISNTVTPRKRRVCINVRSINRNV